VEYCLLKILLFSKQDHHLAIFPRVFKVCVTQVVCAASLMSLAFQESA